MCIHFTDLSKAPKRKLSKRRKIGALFVSNVVEAQTSVWSYSMDLLGDLCQVEAWFGPSRNSVNLRTR
jgi:hypothetical protein